MTQQRRGRKTSAQKNEGSSLDPNETSTAFKLDQTKKVTKSPGIIQKKKVVLW